MVKENSSPEETLRVAKDQILARKYVEKHFFTSDCVMAIPVVVDKRSQKIVLYDVMQLVKEQVLEKEQCVAHV